MLDINSGFCYNGWHEPDSSLLEIRWRLNMIRLDFENFVDTNSKKMNARGRPTYGYGGANREYWKGFIVEAHKKHPQLITKSKNGNGTHTDVGSLHLQATSHWSLYVVGDGVSFSIDYSQIKFMDIDEENRLFIFNEKLAIKF